MKLLRPRTSGFTLIELMLVIVIIGILSAVVIGVINPVKIQNRARDATTKSTMEKISIAASAYVSATGRIPSGSALINELTVSVLPTASCIDTTAACAFTISGNPLPVTCAAAGDWKGSGTGQCNYYYCGSGDAASDASTACSFATTESNYRLIAKEYLNDKVMMFKSLDSKLYECIAAGTGCVIIQ